MSEKELIDGCLHKDKAYELALYQKYASKMMTVCRLYARHKEEAEDLLQDAFIKVFVNLPKFEQNGSLEGWVRRIVINTALKHVKKSSFKNEDIGIAVYHDPGVSETIISKISADELINIIGKLPTGYKLVFNLYAIEGYSHKEIGELLEIKESTSRSQLAKARKMLQSQINKLQSCYS